MDKPKCENQAYPSAHKVTKVTKKLPFVGHLRKELSEVTLCRMKDYFRDRTEKLSPLGEI